MNHVPQQENTSRPDNLTPLKKENGKISRRTALAVIETSVIATLTGIGIKIFGGRNLAPTQPEVTKTPTKVSLPVTPQAPTMSSTPSLIPTVSTSRENINNYEIQEVSGVKFYFDKTGLPLKVIMSDGTEEMFSKEKMLALRKKSLEEGVGDVVKIFRSSKGSLKLSELPKHTESRDHPIVDKLPNDILSETDLSKRGVTIVQSTNGVSLYLRIDAFSTGNVLEDYQQNGRNTLAIVLCPGPIVWSKFMKDERYSMYIKYLQEPEQSLEQFKAERIQNIKSGMIDTAKTISEIQSQLLTTRTETEQLKAKLNVCRKLLEMARGTFRKYTDIYTDLDWKYELLGGRHAGGLYVGGDSPVIFVAVGNDDSNSTLNLVKLNVTADGIFQISEEMGVVSGNNFEPQIEQTFPNPDDLFNGKLNSSDPYIVAAKTPSFALMHEAYHDQEYHRGQDYRNETITDKSALNETKRRWEIWKKSSFKDNTSQSFVFVNSKNEIILS
ncbi:MAG: hypothetical protein WCO33_03575 [bacterium]